MNNYQLKFVNDELTSTAFLKIVNDNFFQGSPIFENSDALAGSYNFVFMFGNEIIGTIAIDIIDLNSAAFRLVAIAKEFRKRGLGSILIETAEQLLKGKNINNVYIRSNPEALNFYKRLGYKEANNNLFDTIENTIFMKKKLNQI